MAGLKQATATDTVVLLGVTEPYDYPAGVMGGNAFEAGTSRKICVALQDESDFYVMRMKTETVNATRDVLGKLKRGSVVEVDFFKQSGDKGTVYICTGLRAATPAAAPAASR